eukprot:1292898-Rhodomonas_salina.2
MRLLHYNFEQVKEAKARWKASSNEYTSLKKILDRVARHMDQCEESLRSALTFNIQASCSVVKQRHESHETCAMYADGWVGQGCRRPDGAGGSSVDDVRQRQGGANHHPLLREH